ncbi:DUF488 domain-containing protein [Robertmurraya kyonggiensis]|uniref:DUF488 domain-containing protein n=1 Tax=Robertmurraya kyonggiensis TaxID=1037680 RepID=A0A4U1D237_9BACI|nr:DUF488 domain-containing protein [Robertmurraya kyonggiensis]TKC16332.1 DUF488 domain-containing protein [Robertmurraya kyonggiensis]
MNTIKIKRIYEPSSELDGYRVLVDRLWPRGISKEKSQIDEWAKEIAPSTDLRKQFNHMPDFFDEFTKRYVLELTDNVHKEGFLSQIREQLGQRNVTLLYAAKNESINHAIVLKEWLEFTLG